MTEPQKREDLFIEGLSVIGQNMAKPLSERPFQDESILNMLADLGVGSGWINLYQPQTHIFYSPGRQFLIESTRTADVSKKLQAEHFDAETEREPISSHGAALDLYLRHTAIELIREHCQKQKGLHQSKPSFPTANELLSMLSKVLRERGEVVLAKTIDSHTSDNLLQSITKTVHHQASENIEALQKPSDLLLEPKDWDWIPFRLVYAEERLATIMCYESLIAIHNRIFADAGESRDAGELGKRLWNKIEEKYDFAKLVKSWRLNSFYTVAATDDLVTAIISEGADASHFHERILDAGDNYVRLSGVIYTEIQELCENGQLKSRIGIRDIIQNSACRPGAIKGTAWKHLLIFPVIVDARFQGCFLGEYLFERDQISAFRVGSGRLRLLLQILATTVLFQIKTDIEVNRLKADLVNTTSKTSKLEGPEEIVGRSKVILAVKDKIHVVAPTTSTVLIVGETGTGKELVARAIHNNSPRRNNLFLPINCAGLTDTLLESELFGHVKGAFTGAISDHKGLFKMANKGTMLLDEIGDMPLNMQAKLLRVLQDGVVIPVGSHKQTVVDVRVISATHQDLTKLIEEKKFRKDLYFRINVVQIALPPLRDRPEDIPLLAIRFLKINNATLGVRIPGFEPRALEALVEYKWPGNVRELETAIERAVIYANPGYICAHHLPEEIVTATGKPSVLQLKKAIDLAKIREISRAFIITNNNILRAAERLGITRQALHGLIKTYSKAYPELTRDWPLGQTDKLKPIIPNNRSCPDAPE